MQPTHLLHRRTAQYFILAGLAIIGFSLLVSGLALILGDVINVTPPFLGGLALLFLTLSLIPLRDRLKAGIERHFARNRSLQLEVQQSFGQELTGAIDLTGLMKLLRRLVANVFAPDKIHIYIFDPVSANYKAMADEEDIPTSDICFNRSGALAEALKGRNEALVFTDLGKFFTGLEIDQARLSVLGANVFVPMNGATQLMGWLALRQRRTGGPYAARELNILQSLANQAALMVERFLALEELERRVSEMNVLTRVAQGVSFTQAFDDIFELISSQTAQVVPAKIFHVTMLEEETGLMFNTFCLENGERSVEREGRSLSAGRGLDVQVITNHQAIITDDYERECRLRGLLVDLPGVFAWMGVPLNAGAETIGSISVASPDPLVCYTDQDCNLLQAIADQAAGAIVKARSLDQAEQRARQLAKLYELGVSLTSTLDLKALLSRIMQSAVEILNCDAGSIFLVDPHTGELIFEVVLGPVAENLVGNRLPPGSGLAGQVQQFGEPIIANDAKRKGDWFSEIDAETGYDTQDMLVVPMRVLDRVIGVIEVINKRDGTPFTDSDQVLLTTFTNQATIAIENARLYTMTDEALAATVQELEVMQRIDHELNASLDIEQAMRLTLEWAMSQSHTEVGLAGSIYNDGIQVIVAQGEMRQLEGSLLADQSGTSLNSVSRGRNNSARPNITNIEQSSNYDRLSLENQPALRQAIDSNQVVCRPINEAHTDGHLGLAANTHQQLIVPIRRGTNAIGVLLLESTRSEPYSEEMISFLTRLSNHAAIAIANAQLYEEVKQANLAKSRFVSFVVHELKNPMASIKGYTELVSSGMAGPINDMQSGFLATVRSNVDRMNAIVSDLNDLTKIQVGNLRLEYQSLNILEVLEEVMHSLKRQVEGKNQQLVFSPTHELPAVWADPARLAQILTNLISNASKYTPDGRPLIIGAERYAEVEGAFAGAVFLHIWVQDFGIGISEEDQEKIFQQYFRTEAAKEMATGTGLGLSISKSLVELQGGRIWFESAIGSGTTFHFTVPVVEA